MAQTLSPPRPTLEDPEPEQLAPTGERRRVTAREAFVTVLVCLGLWALLFAPVLERDAESGPIGTRRSVALAVLRPLTAASDVLGVDRATEPVLRALGRDPDAPPGGELELPDIDLPPLPPIDTSQDPTPPPPPEEGPTPAGDPAGAPAGGTRGTGKPTPAPGIRVPTPESKLRVAVIGDSLSQGLGPEIAAWFDPAVSRVLSLGRQSTGLARQDYFNWQLAMRKIEQEFRPDLIFVLLGSNDNQAQVTPDGTAVPVGSVAWVQSYRERAATLLAEATSNGTRVVWVGIPVVREHDRWAFYRRVNAIYREVASADPLATYVDSWDLFQSRDGDYAAYLRNERGILQEMRAPDGLHMTPTGYGYLARAAIRAADLAFSLSQRAVIFKL
jgi:hypothetical protein